MPLSGISPGLGIGGGASATSSGAPSSGGFAGVTRQSDLVGWWKFDENTGTSAADSIGSNNATLEGDSTWFPGKNGSSLQCDGTGSYAYTGSGNGPTVGADASLSFWVRLHAGGATGGVCSRDYSNSPSFLAWGQHNQVAAYINGSATTWTFPHAFSMGEWHLLTFVYDGTADTVAAYLDGSAMSGTASSVSVNPFSDFADGVLMGAYASSGSPVTGTTLNGEVDDVRIYDAALSASDASDIWGNGEGDWDLTGGKLLNDYPVASVAYSLRLINGDYTGSCLRVRRSSDNAEQDVGFSSGVIDTSSMETFVGSGNDGFVVKWYDQSGNSNDASQSTALKQPKIVSSATTVSSGGKPAIEFNEQRLDISLLPFNRTSPQTALAVCELDVSAVTGDDNEAHIFGVGSSSNGWMHNYGDKLGADANGTDMELIYNSASGSGPTIQDPTNITDDAIMLAFFTNDGTTNKLSHDNGSPVSNTTSLSPYAGYSKATIGAGDGSDSGTTASDWRGKISEVIQWHSSQDGNRSGIKTNINDFYSIW